MTNIVPFCHILNLKIVLVSSTSISPGFFFFISSDNKRAKEISRGGKKKEKAEKEV